MPKLPIVSGREVIKALTKLGFGESRSSGRHVIVKKKSNEKTLIVTIPLQKELAPRTLLSIIRQSGMTKEQFIEFFKDNFSPQWPMEVNYV